MGFDPSTINGSPAFRVALQLFRLEYRWPELLSCARLRLCVEVFSVSSSSAYSATGSWRMEIFMNSTLHISKGVD